MRTFRHTIPTISPLKDPLQSHPAMRRLTPALSASVSNALESHHSGPIARRLPANLQSLPHLATTNVMPARLRNKPPAPIAPLAPKRFPVAPIDLSRPDVALPFGLPRRVRAATLKSLAGGHATDQLLRKTLSGWEFVEDSSVIDLSDNSVEFRVGRLTIFS